MISIPRWIKLTAIAALLPAAAMSAETEDSGWEVSLHPHFWIPSLDADTGSGDASTDVDVSSTDVAGELEGAALLNLEVRKDRFGVLVHGMYSKVSANGPSPGPFFNYIDTTIELGEMDLGLFYRVLEGERGWLDLLAGARYMYVGFDYEMQPDYAAIDEFTADLVDQAVDAIHDQIESEIDRVAEEIAAKVAALPGGEGAAARNMIRGDVPTSASFTAEDVVAMIDHRLPPGKGSNQSYGGSRGTIGDSLRSGLSGRIERSARNLAKALQDAVADEAQRRIDRANVIRQPATPSDAKTEAIRDQIKESAGARIDSIKQNASARAREAIEEAEAELAEALKEAATMAADADHAESRDWVDPFVGLRGRLDVTHGLYVGARADIGGAGVGSDLTWQVFGGVGYDLNEHFALEIGWRYLSIDYEEDDFVFDASLSGVTLGMGITF